MSPQCNPANIAPLTPLEQAQHMAALAGSADALLARAVEALEAGDERWAVRLAQAVLTLVKSGDADAALGTQAHEILAGAYESMAAQVLPITAKNYLQTAALELRD